MSQSWKLKLVREIFPHHELKRLCPEIAVTDLDEEIKNMEQIFYELEISRGCQSWTVLKDKGEICEFARFYQKNFRRCMNFENFFTKGLEILQNHHQIHDLAFFQDFFEIEYLEYRKLKSLKMLKKCGGRYIDKCLCQGNWLLWKHRDFIITADGVLYCHHKEKNLKEFISFGKSFRIKKFPDIPHIYGIMLVSNHRKLLIQAEDLRDYFTFLFYLDKAQSVTYQNIRYDSFAPVRSRNNVDFYIDGQDYFKAVAHSIKNAKHQVFICGWWVSPEFHLIRPCNTENKEFRLDKLLQQVAMKSVKVYILVYWESTFLTNCSEHTKISLEKLHPNIKVIRHPDIILPSFWSHHEKIVLIDQHQCFMGGLDICYGRYDNYQHSINVNSEEIYPGVQYNNTRITDFKDVRNFRQSDIPRNRPRLPWHDVALSLKGETVKDLCHHFIEYWNFASYQVHKLERLVLVSRDSIAMEEGIVESKKERIKNYLREQVEKINNFFREKFNKNESSKSQKQSDQDKGYIQTSKPLSRMYKNDDFDEIDFQLRKIDSQKQLREKTSQNQIKICQVQNKPVYRLTVPSKVFPQQKMKSEISAKQTKESSKKLDGFSSEGSPDEFDDISDKNNCCSYISQRYEAGSNASLDKDEEGETCQALRSVSHWSIGCKQSFKEKSISQAYIDTILNAKYFIYIENQFFISAVKGEEVVKNKIAEAIIERISQAIIKKQKFKVFVIMPLIPGFAGELYDSSASLPRVIMSWQYRTICRHKNSIYQRLRQLTSTPEDYIRFLGLRTHGVIDGKPITQIIYLHSKLLIADDRKLLMGSANINDRSMEGDRDSQICLLVEKGEQVEKMINSEIVMVNRKIHQMRTKLWMEHFGLEDFQCEDPFNEENQKKLISHVEGNTCVYRKVFSCYPDDSIRKMKDLSTFIKKQINTEEYEEQKKKIRGFAVEFPLKFLEQEDLSSLHPDILST